MKYIIKWNAGYGDNVELVECDSQKKAEKEAYDAWREEAEMNAKYSAEELTEENAEEHGFEGEL